MTFQLRKTRLIIIAAIILLALLNPTRSDFAEYLGRPVTDLGVNGLSRKMNFLVFSVYQDDEQVKYLGVCKNFIRL